MGANRYRRMFRFWLDTNQDDQRELAGYVDDLKERRQYTSTIRDGLLLIRALRAGDVSLLLKMFPFVEEIFREKYRQTESPANEEFAAMLRKVLNERDTTSTATTPAKRSPLPELPAFVESTADGREVRQNMATNMGNLFDDDDDDLWD